MKLWIYKIKNSLADIKSASLPKVCKDSHVRCRLYCRRCRCRYLPATHWRRVFDTCFYGWLMTRVINALGWLHEEEGETRWRAATQRKNLTFWIDKFKLLNCFGCRPKNLCLICEYFNLLRLLKFSGWDKGGKDRGIQAGNGLFY